MYLFLCSSVLIIQAPSSFQNLFIKNRYFDRFLSFNLKLVMKTSLRSFPSLVFPRVWNTLTLESKRSESLSVSKKKILIDNLENTRFLIVFKSANHAIKVYCVYTCSMLTIFKIKNV